MGSINHECKNTSSENLEIIIPYEIDSEDNVSWCYECEAWLPLGKFYHEVGRRARSCCKICDRKLRTERNRKKVRKE